MGLVLGSWRCGHAVHMSWWPSSRHLDRRLPSLDHDSWTHCRIYTGNISTSMSTGEHYPYYNNAYVDAMFADNFYNHVKSFYVTGSYNSWGNH